MHAIGSMRRLRAMAVRGFSTAWIADRTHQDAEFIDRVRNGDIDIVSQEFHDSIKALSFHSLSLSEPQGAEAEHTRDLAAKSRWEPFGVWPDMDDPLCVPEVSDPETDKALRRLRRLHARGYTASRLATELGFHRILIGRVLHNRADMPEELCSRILDSYERLSSTPAPQGYGAARSRNAALRRGWDS